VVGDNSSGQTLDEAVAEAPIVFNAPRVQSYSLYGYPAAGKFSGGRLRVCQTSWSMDDSATPEPRRPNSRSGGQLAAARRDETMAGGT
jgi:hypothetical protein